MADWALVLSLDVVLHFLNEGENFFKGGLKEANSVVLEVKEDHQCLSLHFLAREIFLILKKLFEVQLGDVVIFLAAPESKHKGDWRVCEFHVMRGDSSSDDGINECERFKRGEQSNYQL